MEKHKYEKKVVLDAVGILDKTEDGRVIFCVGDKEFDFNEMVETSLGTELHFKSELIPTEE